MAIDRLTHLPAALGGGGAMHRPLTPGTPVGHVPLARPVLPSAPYTPMSGGCGGGVAHAAPSASYGPGGRTVHVCPPRTFTFTKLGAGLKQTLVLLERIDCSAFQTADLIVRVHTDASIDTDCFITVEVVPDGFTHDDPDQQFFAAELDPPVTFSGASPPSAGDVEVRTYSSGLGAMLAVRIIAEQSDPVGEDITARLSVDLVLRDC